MHVYNFYQENLILMSLLHIGNKFISFVKHHSFLIYHNPMCLIYLMYKFTFHDFYKNIKPDMLFLTAFYITLSYTQSFSHQKFT